MSATLKTEMLNESPRPDVEEQHPMYEMLGLVRKNWLLVCACVALGIFGAAFLSSRITRIYRASTTVQIDPNPPRPLGQDVQSTVDMGAGNYWNTQEYYQTQHEILKSRRLARETVEQLGLGQDGPFQLNLPTGAELPPEFKPNDDSAVGALKGRLELAPVGDSRLVKISFEDAEPARASKVLRTLVELFIDQNVDDAVASTNVASDWLNVQLDKLKTELNDNEHALHDFKSNKQILSVSLDDQSNMLREEMQQLNRELTRVRTTVEQLKARVLQLSKINVVEPGDLPSDELLKSSVLQRLRGDLVSATKEQEGFIQAGKGANHPLVKRASSRVEISRKALLQEVNNIRLALSAALTGKQKEAEGLTGLVARAKQRALELNRLGLDYRRLERAKLNTERVYSLVLERTKESDLTRFMRFNNIRVVDAAITHPRPVAPRTPLNIALGAIFGLGLGVALAFARLLIDRTVRSAEEAESLTGYSVLAMLPKTSTPSQKVNRRRRELDPNPLIVHESPNSGPAEAARALRTNLMFTDPDKERRCLLITSAGPSEGKTTVATWIATAFAQTGKRVLLVDCDLRRPRLHRVFGRVNNVGVSSLLIGEASFDEIDVETTIPNLGVLNAGPVPPNPAELLQSKKLEGLLEFLGKRYDVLIIDSPPLVAVTDAAILSRLVDGSLLITRAHSTQRHLVKQGARILHDVDAKVFGCVVNAFDNRKSSSYGYGYGRYAYNYQYKQDDDGA